jgi:hypothetical protein
MNKDLKDRVFNIPQNILDKINHTIKSLGGQHVHGVQRAQKLLTDKTVKYGQLKRIIHDFQKMDKAVDRVKYDLAGGDLMDKWSKQHLQGERDLVSNVKDARKRADEISSIGGERKNSHLKSHTKDETFKIPTNLLKSNSHKSTISPISSLGLFEQIQKFKKLISY